MCQDKIGVGKGAKDQRVDEIKDFVNASWYGDTNSCWRLFEFPLNQMSPAVTKLALHLPNQQFVTYNPERVETEEDLRNVMEAQERTTLTAFFELNREDPEANQYTYPEILRYYRWVANEGGKKKFFQKRKKDKAQEKTYQQESPLCSEESQLLFPLVTQKGKSSSICAFCFTMFPALRALKI